MGKKLPIETIGTAIIRRLGARNCSMVERWNTESCLIAWLLRSLLVQLPGRRSDLAIFPNRPGMQRRYHGTQSVRVHKGICTATCFASRGEPYLTNGCPIVELKICRLPAVFVSGQVLATPGKFLSRSRLELAVRRSASCRKGK